MRGNRCLTKKGNEMKTGLSVIVVGFLTFGGGLSFPPTAVAETILGDFLKDNDVEVEVSGTMDFFNKYVWRGFLLDDDFVLQPGVTISSNGFEGGFWGSWDLQSKDTLSSDEVDGWIGYSFDCGSLGETWSKVGLSIGHTWYNFPEADLYSKEFYFGVSLDTFLSPYLKWYNDYEDEEQGGADGNYIVVGIGHGFDLLEDYGVSVDLGLEYGYNDNAFIDGTGSYILTTAGVNFPLTDQLTMIPKVGFSAPFGDLNSGGGNDQNEQLYGGVSLAFSF